MLKVKLATENNVLIIKEYALQWSNVSKPSNNDGITLWNLNAFNCENIKGSFRLTYSYKISLNKLSSAGMFPNMITIGGIHLNDLADNNTRIADADSNQCLLFTRRTLFYINEKEYSSALNGDKKKLPHFLLIKEKEAMETIQFFIAYDKERNNPVDKEEITFYLNLFRN